MTASNRVTTEQVVIIIVADDDVVALATDGNVVTGTGQNRVAAAEIRSLSSD